MTALPVSEWIQLSDEELDELDSVEEKLQAKRHNHSERKAKADLLGEGAVTILMVPWDLCNISGHRWIPEAMFTRRCSTCNLWEAII